MKRPPTRRPSPHRLARLAVLVLTLASASGCLSWPGGARPTEEGLPPLVLAPSEASDPLAQREAEELLDRSRDALWEDRAEEAAELARTIVEEYPATDVSGASLMVLARAELALGRENEARVSVERYADLLPVEDPRSAELDLFRAEEILASGDPGAGVRAILALPSGLPRETREHALHRLRRGLSELEPESVDSLLASTAEGHPLAPPLMVARARAFRAAGEEERATHLAEAALAAGAVGPDEETARALLALAPGEELTIPGAGLERAPPPRWTPFDLEAELTVGVLLPTGASPAMAHYAEMIEEGIRVALEGADAPRGLSLTVEDDGESPAEAAGALGKATMGEVIGILGPLESDALIAVADARTEMVPIISPTALRTGAREAVYSLGGRDPGAARTLARYAVESGLDQVVIVHRDSDEHAYEAELLRSSILELEGSVLRVISYPRGTTTFGELLETVSFLEPEALVLSAPAEDILALAPQVSFYGLDTLGIRLMGTEEWTSEEVRRNVAPRHSNGVVIATPRKPGEESEAYRRFERAYEEHFRRSLRDPVPALGYDAASLFVEALRLGARTPEEVRQTLATVEDFDGATGTLSVTEGRIVRRHHLACIQDGEIIPVAGTDPPTPYRRERRGDAERGEPERVPLGPMRVFCPGEPVPDTAHIYRTPDEAADAIPFPAGTASPPRARPGRLRPGRALSGDPRHRERPRPW